MFPADPVSLHAHTSDSCLLLPLLSNAVLAAGGILHKWGGWM